MDPRFIALAGLAAGLGISPVAAVPGPGEAVIAGLASAALLLARRPRGGPSAAWLALLAGAFAAIGLGAGTARLAAIDAGALRVVSDSRLTLEGFVAGVPRRTQGIVRIELETAGGRVLTEVPEPVADLAVGARVRATGPVREPAEWERAYLERLGIARVLVAQRLEPLPGRRGGLVGRLDDVRARAEAALGDGTPPAAAALLRGFVLGQDDRIDAATRDEFKRSGLAHLLAVSGQNVILLALLATTVMAVLGTPLRARLLITLGLVALYVPVAGAGPSIQRAGVMGAAGIVAALASRPRSRVYALLLAVAATLALNPRASADVGWQLSFAAVLGILVLAQPFRERLASAEAGPLRAGLAEGAALTIAATLATAPLMAFHFGAVSLASLPANLVALPAAAPTMWLGMLAAAAGQLPGLPVAPLASLAGLLAGFIAQVAEWFSAPSVAQLDARLGGPGALVVTYVMLAALVALALRHARRRCRLRPRRALRALPLAALAGLLAALALVAGADSRGPERHPGLTVSVLDVGQGDAILLQPADGGAVLVDAGPPGIGMAGELRERDVDGLEALILTHPQADHAGAAPELLAELEVGHLAFAEPDRGAVAAARASGVDRVRLAAGDVARSGTLRLEVLWPPPARLERSPAFAGGGSDPNHSSLVLLARWRGFRLLLMGDAETEAVPLDPGPLDVLKVAHHGSADSGLAGLLARSSPELAVVSVGKGNPYGHPAPETLAALADARVPALRTDRDGEVRIEVAGRAWRLP